LCWPAVHQDVKRLLWVESGRQGSYRTLINLSSGHLKSQGRRLKLSPGMQVNAEIHLGTRTVLEYLLSPVQKAA